MRSQTLVLFLLVAASSSAVAEIHDVKMPDRAAGPMVYESDYVHAKPGDAVKFLNASADPNAATIDGLVPEGHAGFKGKINQEIEVTLDQEGSYGIKRSPHIGMGMLTVIRVGDTALPKSSVRADVPARARKRFDQILVRAGFEQ